MVIGSTILLLVAMMFYWVAKVDIQDRSKLIDTHDTVLIGLVLDFFGRLGLFWVTRNTVGMSPGYWITLLIGPVLTFCWMWAVLYSPHIMASKQDAQIAIAVYWIWLILTVLALVQQVVRIWF